MLLRRFIVAANLFSKEARLICKERKDEAEEALQGFGQPQPPASLKDLEQRGDLLTQQAILDVKSASPTWSERFTRYVGGKVIGRVMTVDSADKAQVDDAITRATLQASANAEKLLAVQDDKTLGKINARARQTTTSMDFLKQKLTLCTDVENALNQELTDTQNRLKASKNIKAFDRSVLTQSVADLEKRKAIVEGIRGDIDAKVSGTAESFVQQEVAQSDDYLRRTIALYKPGKAAEINAMLLEWVEGNATGKDMGSADLMTALKDVAEEMFPGDVRRQQLQLAAMKRTADKLTSKGSTWSEAAKRTLVQAGPGAALALTGVGIIPGVAAVGAGYLAGYAYRRYKYGANANSQLPGGRIDAANTKKEWRDNQVASYYRELGVQTGREVAKLQGIPSIADRLKGLAALKPGTSFSALVDGTGIPFSVMSTRDDFVIVADRLGNVCSFDIKGDGKGSHLFTLPGKRKPFAHKTINTNDTGEHLFAIA